VKSSNIATELDRAFAAATRHALMNDVVISDTIGPRTSLDGRQAQKCAVPQHYGLKSQDRAGAVVL
jgi:hypothetical protein